MLGFAGCAGTQQDIQVAQQGQQSVSCATSKGDLRTLENEKIHTGEQIAAGSPAVFPVSLVVNLDAGNEAADYRVATAKYNELIDQRIAEIVVAL